MFDFLFDQNQGGRSPLTPLPHDAADPVVLFSLNETYQGSALSHIEGTLLCLPFTKIMAFCHKALFFQLP